MNDEQVKQHLEEKNDGLKMGESFIEKVEDVKENGSSKPGRLEQKYKLVIFQLDKQAYEWIKAQNGWVYFDLEKTQFRGSDISSYQERKRARITGI